MNFLSEWLSNNMERETPEDVSMLNKKVKNLSKPSVLTQGKKLNYNQAQKVDALTAQLRLMDEPLSTNGTFIISNQYLPSNLLSSPYKEGFGSIASSRTLAKNSSELAETNELSSDFAKKHSRYDKEIPALPPDAQRTDRNKDYNKEFEKKVNVFYDIQIDNENENSGCYKNTGAAALEYQADINDVSVKTCKMRASDLGYSGFAIKKNGAGKLGCYLTNNVEGAQAAGLATKPVASFTFKKNGDANMGGLLMNGQIGIFRDKVENELTTDLQGVAGCDPRGNTAINNKSIVATYGGNCKIK